MIDSSSKNGACDSPIGPLPVGWGLVRLQDVTTKVGSGATPTGGEKVYLKHRLSHALIRSQHVFDRRFNADRLAFISDQHALELRNAEVQPNDILLNITGDGITFGRACLVPEQILPACVNQHVSIIRVDVDKCDPGYLVSFLTHPTIKSYIESFNAGGSRRAITKGHIESFEIPLPPLNVQRHIAAILSTLDDKIELNRRINGTLEAMARRLFRSWFIDFDPIHSKAALRREHPKLSNNDLSRRALPDMVPAIAELFPDSFEDSTLGLIPKGWKAGTVPDAIEINPPRSLSKGIVAPWLEMSNMPTRSARALSWEHREFGSGTKFINGDTLVARITPCLENGKTAFVDFLNDGQVGAGSTEYIVLRPKLPLVPIFAYLLARTDDFRQHLITNMTGTSGRQRAPADCLKKFPLVTPSREIANCFGEATDNLFAQMKMNDEESSTLIAARNSLLPRLLSGELLT